MRAPAGTHVARAHGRRLRKTRILSISNLFQHRRSSPPLPPPPPLGPSSISSWAAIKPEPCALRKAHAQCTRAAATARTRLRSCVRRSCVAGLRCAEREAPASCFFSSGEGRGASPYDALHPFGWFSGAPASEMLHVRLERAFCGRLRGTGDGHSVCWLLFGVGCYCLVS